MRLGGGGADVGAPVDAPGWGWNGDGERGTPDDMDGLTSMAEWRRDRAGGKGVTPVDSDPACPLVVHGGGGAGGKRKALWFWKVSLELSGGGCCWTGGGGGGGW